MKNTKSIMKETKSSIIFIVLSIALLIGISLLPESSVATAPMTTEASTPTPAVALETQSSYLAPGAETPSDYMVTVKEY